MVDSRMTAADLDGFTAADTALLLTISATEEKVPRMLVYKLWDTKRGYISLWQRLIDALGIWKGGTKKNASMLISMLQTP